jgi:hypothetical protein
MTVSAGLNSSSPIISFYSAILIFGIFSWLHFYKQKLGAILLTVFTLILFFSWPIHLLIEHFSGDEYKPGIVESGIPLIFGIITIFSVWKGKKSELNKYVKITLAVLPLLLAIYVGGYFTIIAFG